MPVAARAAPIGAHVSVAGGLSRALARADAVGAEAIQLFVANPRVGHLRKPIRWVTRRSGRRASSGACRCSCTRRI